MESSSGSDDSSSVAPLHLRFGLYEVNLQKRELRKGGLRLRIPHQSFQILAMLLEKPGQLISREDLKRELWPSDVFVNYERSLNSAVQKLRSALRDTSRKPRYIETLPREGYRFIAGVERLMPASTEVPADAAILDSVELSSDLPSDNETSDELSTVRSAQHRNWRYWAAALFLVLIVVYVWHRYDYDYENASQNQPVPDAQAQPTPVVPSSLVPPSLPRRSVAIIGFTNVSGNARNSWLSTAFTEMLATELAAGDHLRTVAEEHVARAKLELSLADRDSYAGDTLTKIHKDLGCDYVVAGSYLAVGEAGKGRLRLDARLQDALTGETVASVKVVGSQSDIFDLASRAGEQMREKLGMGTLSVTESQVVKAALPSDPEAARLYSDGLAKMRVYDDVAASDLFQRVIRLQPEYSPAYLALATAWSDLGYDAKAAAAARKAMDLAQNLPPEARLQTEARYHEMNGDWTRAIEVYSRLQQSYPDNLDYSLNLAAAQDAMGKNAEAAATLAAVRKSPSPERDDPRIDITEARIAGNLGDFKREQTLADSAARKAEINRAGLLLARAKLIDGLALFFLGDLNSAVGADAEAQRMIAESGDLGRSAIASMNIGGVLATQGDIIGATHSIERALTVFRKQGDQAHLASALSNLGSMYEIEGDLPRAENLFREAVAIFTKLNRTNQNVTCSLAELLQRRGKLREAKDMLEPELQHFRSEANNSNLGSAMQTLGSIAETQGDLATALRMYQDAVAHLKETGAKTDYAAADRSLAKAYLREGDFTRSKETVSEAFLLDRQTGAKTDTALDQIELAEISLAQAGSVDKGALRSAIDQFRLQKITDGEIEAEIVLARTNIQQGNAAEAAKMLEQTTVLSAKSYDPTVRFDVALATAHLFAAQHRFDDARRSIRPELERAAAVGCVRCQMEAQLELGEIEIQAGNAERGRAQLLDLAEEAGRRGFRLLAEDAAAAGK
jgi:DNA-binding winged helix-turn-helix (wHTH) protein/tetratricopeptide (TPR) repeat protein/TolB-like protein